MAKALREDGIAFCPRPKGRGNW